MDNAQELTKICSKCGGDPKPLSAFYKAKECALGVMAECKSCHSKRGKAKAQEPKIPVQEKTCSQCGKTKAAEEFAKWSRSMDGLQSACKDCHNGRYNPIYPRDLSILEKPCSECGATKPAGEFYDDPAVKSGIKGACKTCIHTRNDGWAKSNPEKRKTIANRYFHNMLHDPLKADVKARQYLSCRIWKILNPERVLLHRERDWGKRKGRPTPLAKKLQSQAWFASRPGYRRAASQRRRALMRNAPVIDAYIDIAVVYERDHGICSLCDYPVDRVLVFPDLECATIEHIVAITKGGAHAYANVALAHHYCNSLKHNRPLTPELRAWIRILFERRRRDQAALQPSGHQYDLFGNPGAVALMR